eukprot:Skav233532  [mRNA]  locus=scaffold4243:48617:56964:+ [translate_table: standard]
MLAHLCHGHGGTLRLQVVFHITEPSLERDPYKKSTVPAWAEATVEMPRPLEAPLIPNKVDLCCWAAPGSWSPGSIAILPSAWRDWTGRVNVTFDFPRVTPDYGSLGQGDARQDQDWTPSTLEGKAAGKLTFYGKSMSVQAAFCDGSDRRNRRKVVVRDGVYVREEVMMLVVRLPTAGLAVSTVGQSTAVAYAFQDQEQDMSSLGCDWGISDGQGALTGDLAELEAALATGSEK